MLFQNPIFYAVGHTYADVTRFFDAHKTDFESYKVVEVAPFQEKKLKRKSFVGLFLFSFVTF